MSEEEIREEVGGEVALQTKIKEMRKRAKHLKDLDKKLQTLEEK